MSQLGSCSYLFSLFRCETENRVPTPILPRRMSHSEGSSINDVNCSEEEISEMHRRVYSFSFSERKEFEDKLKTGRIQFYRSRKNKTIGKDVKDIKDIFKEGWDSAEEVKLQDTEHRCTGEEESIMSVQDWMNQEDLIFHHQQLQGHQEELTCFVDCTVYHGMENEESLHAGIIRELPETSEWIEDRKENVSIFGNETVRLPIGVEEQTNSLPATVALSGEWECKAKESIASSKSGERYVKKMKKFKNKERDTSLLDFKDKVSRILMIKKKVSDKEIRTHKSRYHKKYKEKEEGEEREKEEKESKGSRRGRTLTKLSLSKLALQEEKEKVSEVTHDREKEEKTNKDRGSKKNFYFGLLKKQYRRSRSFSDLSLYSLEELKKELDQAKREKNSKEKKEKKGSRRQKKKEQGESDSQHNSNSKGIESSEPSRYHINIQLRQASNDSLKNDSPSGSANAVETQNKNSTNSNSGGASQSQDQARRPQRPLSRLHRSSSMSSLISLSSKFDTTLRSGNKKGSKIVVQGGNLFGVSLEEVMQLQSVSLREEENIPMVSSFHIT